MPELPQIEKEASFIREAIVLAGGPGTRLREILPDLPKCMAPVGGRPFLFHLINYWRMQGIERFIFSLGYKASVIEEYLETQFPTLNFHCTVEKEPLGTGGSLLAAGYFAEREHVLVINGDTLFKIDLEEFSRFHFNKRADCTIALKYMTGFDRYGVVELNEDDSVKTFREKKYYPEGLINGGVYLLNMSTFLNIDFPEKFSFERNYLENGLLTPSLFGQIQDRYFIDIGIPEDYQRAMKELISPALDLEKVNNTWTLFLDRDGVINHEKENGYILNKDEFRFYEGVPVAMKILSGIFGRIFIITNQRGVGTGLMTENDLEEIHRYMRSEIESAGGRLDGIYYCTDTDDFSGCRKPNPGMAILAKKDHPELDLDRTVMAGNKPGDMLFGRNSGIFTVFIATTHPETPFPHPDVDARFDSLPGFAKAFHPAKRL